MQIFFSLLPGIFGFLQDVVELRLPGITHVAVKKIEKEPHENFCQMQISDFSRVSRHPFLTLCFFDIYMDHRSSTNSHGGVLRPIAVSNWPLIIMIYEMGSVEKTRKDLTIGIPLLFKLETGVELLGVQANSDSRAIIENGASQIGVWQVLNRAPNEWKFLLSSLELSSILSTSASYSFKATASFQKRSLFCCSPRFIRQLNTSALLSYIRD